MLAYIGMGSMFKFNIIVSLNFLKRNLLKLAVTPAVRMNHIKRCLLNISHTIWSHREENIKSWRRLVGKLTLDYNKKFDLI